MNNDRHLDKKAQILGILNDFYRLVTSSSPQSEILLQQWLNFKPYLEADPIDFTKLYSYLSKLNIDADGAQALPDFNSEDVQFKKSQSEKYIKNIPIKQNDLLQVTTKPRPITSQASKPNLPNTYNSNDSQKSGSSISGASQTREITNNSANGPSSEYTTCNDVFNLPIPSNANEEYSSMKSDSSHTENSASENGPLLTTNEKPRHHVKSTSINPNNTVPGPVPQININLISATDEKLDLGSRSGRKDRKTFNEGSTNNAGNKDNIEPVKKGVYTSSPDSNKSASNGVCRIVPSLDYVSRALNKPYFTISNYNVYTNISVVEVLAKENTFYLAVLLNYFLNLLNDKCMVNTLANLYEKLQSKKIKLVYHPQEEKLTQSLLTNLKYFINEKIKRGNVKLLYEAFVDRFFKDAVFQDAFVALIKELLIELICSLDAKTFSIIFPSEQKSMNRLFSNIRSNTIEPCEELISLVPNIVESNLEVHYMKDNKIEIVLYNMKQDINKDQRTKEAPIMLICSKINQKSIFQVTLPKEDAVIFQKINFASPIPTNVGSEVKLVLNANSIGASSSSSNSTATGSNNNSGSALTLNSNSSGYSYKGDEVAQEGSKNTINKLEALKESPELLLNGIPLMVKGDSDGVPNSGTTNASASEKTMDIPENRNNGTTTATSPTQPTKLGNVVQSPHKTATQGNGHPLFTKAHSLPLGTLNPHYQQAFDSAGFQSKAKDLLSFFDRHTQNLLQYFPSNHLNYVPSKPNTSLDARSTEKPKSNPYQIVVKPPDHIEKSYEDKIARHDSHDKENSSDYPKIHQLAGNNTITIAAKVETYPIVAIQATPSGFNNAIQPLSVNTLNTNQNVNPYSMNVNTASNNTNNNTGTLNPYGTAAAYNFDYNKYQNALLGPNSPSSRKFPQSYDYGNGSGNVRSPLKKITVYAHQPKQSTFANIDKEASNIDKVSRKAQITSSPTTNRLILDEDQF